jgi:hypothetical protein
MEKSFQVLRCRLIITAVSLIKLHRIKGVGFVSIHLTVEYKAQLIADFNEMGLEAARAGNSELFKAFDAFVKKTLENEYYKDVKIDEHYKRYGMDIGLVSESKKKLSDACHDIAIYTREQPHLKDIEFDDF